MAKTKTEPAPDAGNPTSTAAQPAPAPSVVIKKLTKELRYNFTQEERLALASEQSEALQSVAQKKGDKKAIVSQLKAGIEELEARVAGLSNRIISGFELRATPCEVHHDTPGTGQKSTFRMDTGALVLVEPMTPGEMQRELPLTAPAVTVWPATAAQLVKLDGEAFTVPAFSKEVNALLFEQFLFILLEEGDDSDEQPPTLRSADERLVEIQSVIDDEGFGGAENLIAYLSAKFAEPLPGAPELAEILKAAVRDARAKGIKMKSAEHVEAKKSTPGTVEVEADEGTRDDSGTETKNDL